MAARSPRLAALAAAEGAGVRQQEQPGCYVKDPSAQISQHLRWVVERQISAGLGVEASRAAALVHGGLAQSCPISSVLGGAGVLLLSLAAQVPTPRRNAALREGEAAGLFLHVIHSPEPGADEEQVWEEEEPHSYFDRPALA